MRPHASVQHIDWGKLAGENAEKLCRAMEGEGLDAVILGSMNNIHWITGIPMTGDLPYFFSHFALLTRIGDEPVLFSPYVTDFFPEEREWIQEVRPLPFTKEIEDPTKAVSWHIEIAKTLEEKGITQGRVGIDPRISIPLYEGIREKLPHVEFLSASGVLSDARSIKSEEEVKALRQSCAIAEMGLEAGIEAVKVGATERKIAGEITRALYAGGATALGFMPNIVAGERPGILFSSDKLVRPNELVRVDISSVWGGYYSCIARTVFTGKPPAVIMELYSSLREAHEKSIAYIKPGITNYQLYDFTKKQIEKMTQRRYTLPFFLGHGIGVSIIDEPWIFDRSSCEEKPLLEGMCFLFEPIIHIDGFGDVAITDCVNLKEKGVELLTRTTRELYTTELREL
jgi:Xaa-Pro aminopeptidase